MLAQYRPSHVGLECAEAFTASKQALLRATCLAHPVTGTKLNLAVDATTTHVGCMMPTIDLLLQAWLITYYILCNASFFPLPFTYPIT